ncbi:hypothetical protein CEXT_411991 [Caerostris extrusa]|uniref:Uncharacterized protein n=1 Tax=Caerostris extrusa TaxID=172846 RepID=A0AAV4UI54_CAEEX|nr:hypothetical protein CEXT_411991 [Caerostris extrusa]
MDVEANYYPNLLLLTPPSFLRHIYTSNTHLDNLIFVQRRVSDFCRAKNYLIQIFTHLAPRTCHRNHSLITTWSYTGTLFQENLSTLSQTQSSRHPAREKSRN